MRILAGIWRLAIVALCVTGTWAAWSEPQLWVYMSFQLAFLAGVVMLWSAAASLVRGVQPPAWLKGAVVTFCTVGAVASFFMTPVGGPLDRGNVLGLMTNTMLERIIPIMVILDFLLFQPHRRYTWQYPLAWLAYPPLYVVFVLLRAWWWPQSKLDARTSAYPYALLDLPVVGWTQFAVTFLKMLAFFLAAGAVVCIVDRVLPAKGLEEA